MGGRRARCGDSLNGNGARTSDCRKPRFGAKAHADSEGITLLSKGGAEEPLPKDPEELMLATEQERRQSVLNSMKELEREQHKRVELTTQIEHSRFWGPEATPQLLEEPLPLAI